MKHNLPYFTPADLQVLATIEDITTKTNAPTQLIFVSAAMDYSNPAALTPHVRNLARAGLIHHPYHTQATTITAAGRHLLQILRQIQNSAGAPE
ncbi:MAG: hypothetical protein ACYC4R_17975 [Anaerolineae bacterium]